MKNIQANERLFSACPKLQLSYVHGEGVDHMSKSITASMLYNFVQCPHRVSLDLFGNPAKKDPVSVFVQLLWDKGNEFEREVIENLKLPFTDLKAYSNDAKEVKKAEIDEYSAL